MVLLVFVVACSLAFVHHRALVQRRAVAAVRRAGGLAYYDLEWQNCNPILFGPPSWLKWLADNFGVDVVAGVVYVDLGARGTDSILAHVGCLSTLKELNLHGSSVTDEGLSQILGLTSLEVLCLCETSVSDRGAAHLARLTHLDMLHLDRTRVTDRGVKMLGSLRGLRTLSLHLKAMPHLSVLQLRGTSVDDGALEDLRELRRLSFLDLRDTRVTAAGASRLRAALPHTDVISGAAPRSLRVDMDPWWVDY
jgi:hypothetical protein